MIEEFMGSNKLGTSILRVTLLNKIFLHKILKPSKRISNKNYEYGEGQDSLNQILDKILLIISEEGI